MTARPSLARIPPARLLVGAGAGVAAVVVLVLVVGLRPGPGPGPSPTSAASPAPTPPAGGGLVGELLPTPTTTDVVLLVRSAEALTADERRWVGELRGSLGNVDTLAYAEATPDALLAYFVIVVLDADPALDVTALAGAYAAGRTIHLVGPASAYLDGVIAAAP